MRGKGHIRAIDTVVEGITPAYAGKRPVTLNHIFKLEDHPRLCGEKISKIKLVPPLLGSPPPMRGKALAAFPFMIICGITPAYAGKRSVEMRW